MDVKTSHTVIVIIGGRNAEVLLYRATPTANHLSKKNGLLFGPDGINLRIPATTIRIYSVKRSFSSSPRQYDSSNPLKSFFNRIVSKIRNVEPEPKIDGSKSEGVNVLKDSEKPHSIKTVQQTTDLPKHVANQNTSKQTHRNDASDVKTAELKTEQVKLDLLKTGKPRSEELKAQIKTEDLKTEAKLDQLKTGKSKKESKAEDTKTRHVKTEVKTIQLKKELKSGQLKTEKLITDLKTEDTKTRHIKTGDLKPKDCKLEEHKSDEPKTGQLQTELKADQPKTEKLKSGQLKTEVLKTDLKSNLPVLKTEVKADQVKTGQLKTDIKAEDTKTRHVNTGQLKTDKLKTEEPLLGEIQNHETVGNSIKISPNLTNSQLSSQEGREVGRETSETKSNLSGTDVENESLLKPYLCEMCSRRFKTKRSLARHQRVSCSVEDILKYSQIHTEGKPLTCPYCRAPFKLSSNLDKHVKNYCRVLKKQSTLEGQQMQPSNTKKNKVTNVKDKSKTSEISSESLT